MKLRALISQSLRPTRALARSPRGIFPWLAIAISLTLGVGVSSSAFLAVDALYFRNPAGVSRPERLRRVWISRNASTSLLAYAPVVSYPDLHDFTTGAAEWTQLAGYLPIEVVVQNSHIGLQRVRIALVSADWFDVLGVRVRTGRGFSQAEFDRADLVAVVSSRGLTRLFGADSSTTSPPHLRVNGADIGVVGVAENGFRGIDREPVDLWLPLTVAPALGFPFTATRNAGLFRVVARVPTGVTDAVARGRLAALVKAVDAEHPSMVAAPRTVLLGDIRDQAPGRSDRRLDRLVFIGVQAIAAAVLMIAMGNALLIALIAVLRARGSYATKLALGATFAHLVREQAQRVLPTCLISAGIGLLVGLAPLGLPRIYGLVGVETLGDAFDIRVVSFSFAAVAIVAGMLTFAPALAMTRSNVAKALRSVPSVGGVPAHLRWASLSLVGAQMAASTILCVATVSLFAGLREAYAFDYGFAADDLYAVEFSSSPTSAAGAGSGNDASRAWRLAEHLASGTGARASVTDLIPLHRMSETTQIVSDAAQGGGLQAVSFLAAQVDTGFFATAGMRRMRGRLFASADLAAPTMQAVVNQTYGRLFSRNGEILGRCVVGTSGDSCQMIIGVVNDAEVRGVGTPSGPMVFTLIDRSAREPAILIRRRTSTEAVTAFVYRSAQEVGVPATSFAVLSIGQLAKTSTADLQHAMLVFGTSAAIACLLAAFGMAAVIGYDLSNRRRELGVRAALGATPKRLLWTLGRRVAAVSFAATLAGCAFGAMLVGSIRDLFAGATLQLSIPIATGAGIALGVMVIGVVAGTGGRLSAPPMEALRVD